MTPLATDTQVFLTLFNRHLPEAEDNGSETPQQLTLGPFVFIHGDRRGLFVSLASGEEHQLHFIHQQLFYAGVRFPDWLVFAGQPESVEPFDPEKAIPRRRREEIV